MNSFPGPFRKKIKIKKAISIVLFCLPVFFFFSVLSRCKSANKEPDDLSKEWIAPPEARNSDMLLTILMLPLKKEWKFMSYNVHPAMV